VPAPLALLLVAVAAFGLMWALFIPPFESPDEQSHFAYTETIVQRHALPGHAGRPEFSSAQRRADQAAEATRAKDFLAAINPSWSAASFAAYQASARHLSSSNGGGPNAADPNPPLFYLYSTVGYLAGSGGNEFDHLYDMRVWSVPLLLLTTLSAWLLAGEVFGRRRLAQLTCAAIVGLVPMETFISSSVNPDALLFACWGLALWLGARVVLRGCQRRDALALCAVTAAAVLTKATSYALVPAVLAALVLGRGLARRPAKSRLAQLGPPVLVLVLPILAWVILSTALGRSVVNGIPAGPHHEPLSVGGFLSYLWQFYLPPLPFQHALNETAGLPVIQLWLRGAWGNFGWLSVSLPNVVYQLLAVVTLVIAIPALSLLARMRDRHRLALLAFFAIALVSLLVLLHVTDYRSLVETGQPLVQGRYLLPLLPLFGLAAALLVRRAPIRGRGPVCAAMISGLLILQVVSLATVGRAFYT
jgi:4-amino-4-deoxy-L-arabinose transferase-like glycosyltransferase